MSTELVTIEALKASEVFAPGGVEKLIADVECKVRATETDASTDKGRTAIRSLARRVASSKTALDDMGKEFVAELKRAAGIVDADRRIIRERFDALRDEVRKPADDYEAAEDARKAKHTDAMMELQSLGKFEATPTVAEVEAAIKEMFDLCAREWEEFTDQANHMAVVIKGTLERAHEEAKKRDQDRAELERLRKAEADRQEAERKAGAERLEAERKERAERERRERDERIAAQVKREAEENAAAEQRRIELERQAAVARAEKAERDAKAAEERAEFERAAAIEKAERDRVAAIAAEAKRQEEAKAAEIARAAKAEADAKAAAEKAKRDQEAAIEAERRRVAEVAAHHAAEAKRREADIEHRKTFNNAAVADLMSFACLSKKTAQDVVTAIAGGKISNISIKY